jgi:hypothetical protein
MGFEPTTSSMPSRRAPNCATAPPGKQTTNTILHELKGRVYDTEDRRWAGFPAHLERGTGAQVFKEGDMSAGEGAATKDNCADSA